jgi:PAS domain S-box-containing protein
MGFDDKTAQTRRMVSRGAADERDVLRVALEAADLAVWDLDLAAQAMRVSDAVHHMLGHEPPPVPWSLRMFEQNIFPDDMPAFREAFGQAMASGVLRCEVRMRRRDGRLVWMSMLGRATHDGQGQPSRLTGVMRDISDRKNNEQFVRERDGQFKAMFEVSSVGMAHADPASGNLLRVNERLAAMLGHDPGNLVGRRFLPLLHPEDRESTWSGFQQLVRGAADTYEAEIRLLHHHGGIVWGLVTANLIRDSRGDPKRLVAVIVDITGRKRVEQALLEREDELRRARDELERRVDERTMELAESNRALQIEIAERRAAEERVRELLGRQVQAVEDERGRISRELHDSLGQHLAALTLSLKAIDEHAGGPVHDRVKRALASLDLMENELDRLSYELRPLALDDLGLAEALRSHAAQWSDESGIKVDVHMHGLRTSRLPAVIETTVYRIVQEALTNVRKHAQATRVGLIVERRKDQLRVVLEDDGVGFDATTVTPDKGRRFGLRGMGERARLVGADLEIESVGGRGTTIYLAVPLRDGARE